MKYKLGLAMLDHRGKQMTEETKEGIVNLTLGLVLERACVFGGEQDAKAPDKFKQFKLAQRIAGGSTLISDPVEFTAEEVTTLKKLCAQVYTPIAYGAVATMLESPHPDTTAMKTAIDNVTLRNDVCNPETPSVPKAATLEELISSPGNGEDGEST